MSKLLFLKRFFKNRKEIGSVIPSSKFLAKKMVVSNYINNSNVIIEIWAWTGSFTKEIFKHKLEWKKVFIIEKDKSLYNLLVEKYPEYKKYIYNYDMMDLPNLLKENNLTNIDLIISGIPFRSLSKELFSWFMENIVLKYFDETSIFMQFSYLKNTKKILNKYFNNIDIKDCWLNIPKASIFICSKFKR